MEWLKYLNVGGVVVTGFLEASQDGKITIEEIIKIGTRAAMALGYSIQNEGIEIK